MRSATQSDKSVKEDRLAIQQELQELLAKCVSAAELVDHITRLLKSLGKRPRIEVVARRLAEKLAPRVAHKSEALQTLIKDRWEELTDWADLAAWEGSQSKSPADHRSAEQGPPQN